MDHIFNFKDKKKELNSKRVSRTPDIYKKQLDASVSCSYQIDNDIKMLFDKKKQLIKLISYEDKYSKGIQSKVIGKILFF